MKIRSVTSFITIPPNGHLPESELIKLSGMNRQIRNVIIEKGFEVQSLRCATNPFPEYLHGMGRVSFSKYAISLEALLCEIGYDYISMGGISPKEIELYPFIPELIGSTQHVFASAHLVSMTKPTVSIPAIREAAKIITQLSGLEENGFGNLYFAGLAKVPGEIPFLPAAYRTSGRQGVSIALAMESADLAVSAFSQAKNLENTAKIYKESIEILAKELESILLPVCSEWDAVFLGFDFTPAPFVKLESSAGDALEKLTGSSLGNLSSVSAAAFLMSVLDHAKFKRSGFNGLMLPVLEDSLLAQRAAEGSLTLKDLLLYSTVCGTGLDTVPLPGDITEQQLQAILLDIACIAIRLNKPLTARLMPVPGKQAGDMTSFDFPFFTNTKIMEPQSMGFNGLFGGADSIDILPRCSQPN